MFVQIGFWLGNVERISHESPSCESGEGFSFGLSPFRHCFKVDGMLKFCGDLRPWDEACSVPVFLNLHLICGWAFALWMRIGESEQDG